MQNWTRVSFSEIIKKVSDSGMKFYEKTTFSFLPVFFAYGFTIILLLKLSQIILGWKF